MALLEDRIVFFSSLDFCLFVVILFQNSYENQVVKQCILSDSTEIDVFSPCRHILLFYHQVVFLKILKTSEITGI